MHIGRALTHGSCVAHREGAHVLCASFVFFELYSGFFLLYMYTLLEYERGLTRPWPEERPRVDIAVVVAHRVLPRDRIVCDHGPCKERILRRPEDAYASSDQRMRACLVRHIRDCARAHNASPRPIGRDRRRRPMGRGCHTTSRPPHPRGCVGSLCRGHGSNATHA